MKKPKRISKRFVVINSELKYFCGFERGGKFKWVDDFSQAKEFEDVRKFAWIEKNSHGLEVIMDWT